MTILLNNVSKRFNFEWILKNIEYTFHSGRSYAILGPNGSGKSTLMQMISGSLNPSTGTIEYSNEKEKVSSDDIFRHLSIAAPYLELVEEFTLLEQIIFQQQFKPFLNNITPEEVASIAGLKAETAKQIKNFSSGLKQRLKVALAILSGAQVILLDEPTTNLDQKGVEWYLDLVKNFSGNKLIIVSSNLEREYGFCTERIDVMKYK